MAITNHERVGKMLELLTAGLTRTARPAQEFASRPKAPEQGELL